MADDKNGARGTAGVGLFDDADAHVAAPPKVRMFTESSLPGVQVALTEREADTIDGFVRLYSTQYSREILLLALKANVNKLHEGEPAEFGCLRMFIGDLLEVQVESVDRENRKYLERLKRCGSAANELMTALTARLFGLTTDYARIREVFPRLYYTALLAVGFKELTEGISEEKQTGPEGISDWLVTNMATGRVSISDHVEENLGRLCEGKGLDLLNKLSRKVVERINELQNTVDELERTNQDIVSISQQLPEDIRRVKELLRQSKENAVPMMPLHLVRMYETGVDFLTNEVENLRVKIADTRERIRVQEAEAPTMSLGRDEAGIHGAETVAVDVRTLARPARPEDGIDEVELGETEVATQEIRLPLMPKEPEPPAKEELPVPFSILEAPFAGTAVGDGATITKVVIGGEIEAIKLTDPVKGVTGIIEIELASGKDIKTLLIAALREKLNADLEKRGIPEGERKPIIDTALGLLERSGRITAMETLTRYAMEQALPERKPSPMLTPGPAANGVKAKVG